MPRTAITVNQLPANGNEIDSIVWTNADQTNGMDFDNDGRTLLFVRNVNAAARTMTVKAVADPFGRITDTVMNLNATTGFAVAGPFPAPLFNQNASGRVNVDPSANHSAGDFQIAAIRLPPAT